MIQLEELQEMFDRMRESTSWDVDGPMVWGFFFTHPDQEKLELAATHLQDQGYRFVSIYPTDDDSTCFLHVEKVEAHTPESLDERNQQFYAFAERHGLERYDGMDVGPVVSPPAGHA